jgi:predicted RNA-binding protein YlqC (UPF0109 family)
MLAQAVEHLIKNIVDFPDDVSVKSHENARGELIRVRVNPEDIGHWTQRTHGKCDSHRGAGTGRPQGAR